LIAYHFAGVGFPVMVTGVLCPLAGRPRQALSYTANGSGVGINEFAGAQTDFGC
jgi:ABC-type phosphate transport system substrate-binding protein